MNELHLAKPSTVKMIKPIALLLTLFFSFYADAAVVPRVTPPKFDITKIKARDIERLTGKKLTLLQKVKLKIAQAALRKFDNGELTDKQKNQAEISMILGISSIGLLLLSSFIPFVGLLSIPAAIIAVILGAKSLKGNSNTKGIVGVITGGVTLLLFVVAIIVVLAFFATWGGI